MEIIEKIWFTEFMSPKTIGIIIVNEPIDGFHAFVGTASGQDEDSDAKYILHRGARLHLGTVKLILKKLEGVMENVRSKQTNS
jgi:hypothetical protein